MTQSDHDLAIAAAEAGADVVRALYGEPIARFEKEPGDFATAADLEAERVIIEMLRGARPGDAVQGEESGHTAGTSNDRTWLVDPLCGTANYAARTPLVAVNVALRWGGETTAAASADPFADELFWTSGGNAYLRRDGIDERLAPSAVSRLVDLNVDPPFPNSPDFLAAGLLADPAFNARFQPRILSTTLAVAWVAAGRRAAFVTDGDLRDSVHFAPGIALCQAAGCVVTGIAGQPLHTGVGGLVAAADAETHAALIEIIGTRLASR